MRDARHGPFDDEFSRGGVYESFSAGRVVFAQGEKAGAVYCVAVGKLTQSIIDENGRRVVLSVLGPGDVFGESALLRLSQRTVTVTAIEESWLLRFEPDVLQRKLMQGGQFAAIFVQRLFRLKLRLIQDLAESRIDSSEKRLARALLRLAAKPDADGSRMLPRITHETLAAIVGTTRPRVTTFMAKFRAHGFLQENDGEVKIKPALERILSDRSPL